MATEVTKIKSNVNAICTVGGTESWVNADFKFVIKPNINNAEYDVKVYARMHTPYNMQWSGTSILRVTCNGVSKSNSIKLTMYSSTGGTTAWDGPVSFTFGAPGDLQLNFNIDLDLTPTTGTNGKPGITHTSDGGNLIHFRTNNYIIDVSGIPLIQAPKISDLVNTNQYKNQNNVSASTKSISLKWTSSGDTIVASYYKIGSAGAWIKTSATTSQKIAGLTAGTSYTIYVYSENSAGQSNILSLTVRTKYDIPVVTLSLASINLESLTFNWTSNKSLASCQYKIDGGAWTNLGQTGTSGSFTISGFNPKSDHVIYFKGVSTSTYDSLSSSEVNANGTTADIAHIGTIGECIFGLGINIDIPIPAESNQVKYLLKLQIWTIGNSLNPLFEFDNITPGLFTFNPTQKQLDNMYKCFANQNSIPIRFLLHTHGETKNWADIKYNKSLNLTGIAKTAHIGVDNVPRRAEAHIGVDNVPRRAVVWVGDKNNIPRRCI